MAEFQLQETGPCKRKLSVRVPPDRVKQAVALGWQSAQHSIAMKGFRPGKVPKSLLEKKYGDEIRKEIKQQLVNEAFREAVAKHSLAPVTTPRLDLEKLALDPAKEFSFELDFEVRPQFEVKDWKGVDVAIVPTPLGDADVERELEGLRARLAKPQAITDAPAEAGDYLRAGLTIVVDGATVKIVDDAVVDTIEDRIDGIPAGGGTSQFLGKAVGATVAVPAKWPDDYEPKGFAGADARLECAIKEINRFVPPPLDDELAKAVGLESVDQLRQHTREQLEHHVAMLRGKKIEEQVLDDLIRRTPFSMPEDTLKQMTEQAIHRIAHELMRSGMDHDTAHHTAEKHRERAVRDAERNLRIRFLVDAIAETEKVAVSEQDLEGAVRMLAAQQRRDPQQIADEIVANDGIGPLRAQILEAKVRKLLRESARVRDLEPTERAK